jgi:hypothetical protein
MVVISNLSSTLLIHIVHCVGVAFVGHIYMVVISNLSSALLHTTIDN